ncbi:CCHC-type domain-containing protein [Aphis craccivora]|uniref:CCHC-type domain-containing protein n=1 Tax=Aphis craccivora TaxID=307492 RepID=A0A6G0W8Z3_APHCR|nr:CCHC-type domain-containing protein [Aphis craccivora]
MQLVSAIMEQNPELGLTQDDVESVMVKFKLGPRDRGTTHWVLETPAEVLNKIENKSVFLGLTRCRIRVHQNIPQCYKCQKYGHTSLRCNQESPTCRHCAGSHDSRECTTKNASRCSNCKGDHKASSEACKAKSQAMRGLLRRTDFGSK